MQTARLILIKHSPSIKYLLSEWPVAANDNSALADIAGKL